MINTWSAYTSREKTLKLLEWPKLTEFLSSYACFSHTKIKLANLDPWDLPRDASLTITLTQETLSFASYERPFPLSPFEFSSFEGHLRREAILSPLGLSHLCRMLKMVEKVTAWRAQHLPSFGELKNLMKPLVPLTSLRNQLAKSVDDEGSILETASPALADAHRKLKTTKKRISQSLESLLKDSVIQQALQESTWRFHDGRYVLPVRTDRKSSVPGITRSISQTGATVFVEPASLAKEQAELNETLWLIECEEQKVIQQLSIICWENKDTLLNNVDILTELDELQARALFAQSFQGIPPNVHETENKIGFSFLKASHPLFLLEQKKCVANDLELLLGHVCVLSGPNAGGKTVTMKTAGLLCLMAKCGLFIPCEKALCHSFSEIYVNMGDQQNREEDLSTFSGHLQHIKTILECANHSSLVLLDEGFVGTDPAMGVAIAQAVLEELASKGATVVITTHFSALKTLAIEGSVFKNASMEFESQYLRPTYKLLQNLPGQSYALELCERLGFNHNMINSAKKYYGENPRNFESLLKELQQKSSDLQKIQQKHENLHQNLIEEFENLKNEKVQFQNWRDNIIENYTNKLQKRLNSFENKLEIKERQHEKNLKIRLRKLKNPTITSDPPKSEELLAEVQEAKKKMENSFHHIEERLGTEDHTTLKTKPNLVKTIKESHKKITESKTHYRPANFWQMGMKVKTTRFDQAGIVLKPADHKGLIECQFQFMKVKLPFEDLMTIEDSAKHQTKKNDIISKKIPIPINKTKEANNKLNYEIETVLPHKGNSIDLRGLRVEESIQELEQKLDKLFSDNLTHGVIVHGHGEGKVKEAVRKHLFKCSYSLNFRPGRHGEGGDGVTVVEFL